MNLRKGGCIVLLLVVGMGLATIAAGYEITASDTTPVPEQTVELQDNTYTITETVRVSPGESFSTEVDAPDESYRVYLYNSDREIVEQQRGEGTDDFSFDTSGYEPGSYVVSANNEGDHEAIQPVIVTGYDVSVDAPESPAADESFEVTVDVTQTAADSEPETVKVAIDDDGDTTEFDAEGSDGEYTATIGADELESGDYDVYGVVQSDEQAFGENEIVGLSDPASLSVSESTATATPTQTATPTATESTSDGGDTGGGGDGGDTGGEGAATDTATPTATDSSEADEDNSSADNETATAEPTETATPTATSMPTDTATDAPTTADDGTETTAETTTAPTDEPAETTTAPTTETDDESMITPGDETETTGSTAADGPGFTAAGAVLALVVLFVLRR